MLQLKLYQERALDSLRAYMHRCAETSDADAAFYTTTREVFGRGIPYRDTELPGLPYVCLRMPTGAGKTLVACHSLAVAAHELLQVDHPLVLWLVPSNAILEQTLAALRSREHPYRQAVEHADPAVEPLAVEEALYLKPETLNSATTIIVSTMQSFRVEDTTGRRVYRDSGELMDHFRGVPEEVLQQLERFENGQPRRSLANVLRLRRPIVIVDEAHNARTSLMFDTLARFNPACIIEFTATPATDEHGSNVLHSVSASELRAEQMIKMPIRVETRPDWKQVLSDALDCRSRLAKIALEEQASTGEDIRPIMLLQAQPHSRTQPTVDVETLQATLKDDHHIPREQIAVATGVTNELDAAGDILRPESPILYVITMQALREGWDCPFAYVLCSVAEMRSETYVEQVMGRIMRLPHAHRKTHDELNQAYAFAASADFATIANALETGLINNGFEQVEARALIAAATPVEAQQAPGPVWAAAIDIQTPPDLSSLSETTAMKVKVNAEGNRLVFHGVMTPAERDEIAACLREENAQELAQALYTQSRRAAPPAAARPAAPRQPFAIPILAFRQGALLEPLDETHYLEHPWRLSECSAALSDTDYVPNRSGGQTGEVTVTDSGAIRTQFVQRLQWQTGALFGARNWTAPDLVQWLDARIPHPDIPADETQGFLLGMLDHLVQQRQIPLAALERDKYALLKAAQGRIDEHREAAATAGYQALLSPDYEAQIVVTPDLCFSYGIAETYSYSYAYRGSYGWQRHYYPEVGDLASQGEEFECACYIDSMDEVKHWVRNTANRPDRSFWLLTPKGRFYPDFVCELNDGRYMVVEYKGAYIETAEDAQLKLATGELWEKRSGGRCLFVMPSARDYDMIRRKLYADSPAS